MKSTIPKPRPKPRPIPSPRPDKCHSHQTTKQQLAEAIRLLHKLNRKVHTLAMNMAELQVRLGELGTQLNKALDEIRRAIEAGGQTTPEVDAALDQAKAVAQALDDLNPDQ